MVLGGELPGGSGRVAGCPFHPRCPVAVDRCRTDPPALTGVTSPDHPVACHLVTPEGGGPSITIRGRLNKRSSSDPDRGEGSGVVHHTP